MKKLGLKVPDQYVRINSIRLFPQGIQDELVKFHEIVEEDSSYEDDSIVLRKYKRDPMKYVIANDANKQAELENGGEPWRLQGIKKERGDFNIHEFLRKATKDSAGRALDKLGMVQGVAELDKNKRDKIVNNDKYKQQWQYEKIVLDKLQEQYQKTPDFVKSYHKEILVQLS